MRFVYRLGFSFRWLESKKSLSPALIESRIAQMKTQKINYPELLRLIRQVLEWDQRTAAKRFRVAHSVISQWENRKRSMSGPAELVCQVLATEIMRVESKFRTPQVRRVNRFLLLDKDVAKLKARFGEDRRSWPEAFEVQAKRLITN